MKERWIHLGLICLTGCLFLFGTQPVREQIEVFSDSATMPTLVIDAGHGGFDGGAVGSQGICEQDINLAISQSLYDLCYFFGYPAVMTRTDQNALDYDASASIRENKVADLHARERIANQTEYPIFMSIHLNKFEDAKYFGAQVFYSKNHANSQVLAESLQDSLVSGIQNGNIRTEKPATASIYLMKMLTCPAVVVECGFLSNPQEEQLLSTPEYQTKLAICIFNGYQNYWNGVQNETENTLSVQ